MLVGNIVISLLASASLALAGQFAYLVNNGCDLDPLELTQVSQRGIFVNAVNCDSIFRKQDWQTAPMVRYKQAKPNSKYLLLMLDPDAPNHGEGVFYFHWAVSNIKGVALRLGSFGKANTLLSYVGPAPPKGSGQHRYMFYLYEQDPGSIITERVSERRWMFDLGKWLNPLAKLHPITGPVAGSQFRVMAEI